MTFGGEATTVQDPFLRYAVEAGWTYLSPYEALPLRKSGITSPVLDEVLIQQLQKLNPTVVDNERAQDIVQRLVRVRPNIEGNLDAWQYLKGLKTVFVPGENRERDVRFLDPVSLEANRFHVTDEFTFSNGVPPDIRADIVFFVNGVPVLIVEAKRASDEEGIAKALDDIRYYHKKGPEFLALNQLHALTHLIEFYYGATWSLSRKALFNWRDEAAGDFETLCKSFVAPRRMVHALTDYVLFIRKDGELSKAILRPHQMRAVEKCAGRAKERTKRRGLVWHTQGSGKTYTMITVAKRLIADQVLQNPTVLMLIDRNELEQQLSGVLEAVGLGEAPVASTKEHLRQLLSDDYRGLIVSMIHKFEGIPERINERENFFVLIDEAHRTTGGDLGNYLMGALPDATYIGFTGTPIDKTAYGKGTFKVFGMEDEKGYLDKYSIRESIEDGTTVPLHYALAPNDLLVDRETLEKEFLNLAEAEGVSDFEELNRILDKAVNLKNMLKNRDRVRKVAKFVAEHYRENVDPMGYKALIVAPDREGCCLYKEAIDRHLPPEWSTVVISSGGKSDSELLRRYWLTEDQEKEVRKAFRKPEVLPKILIVTEKLLTGFDAPILYAMYLDKPMRDHVLLQAIARVNRPFEDGEGMRKTSGFVLDFVGIFDKLEKALAFDSEEVKGVIEGIDVLRELFKQQMERGRSEYLPLLKGKKGDKQVEAVLEHFRDKDRRDDFYRFFRELQESYEILSPDPFLRPFIRDYNELTRMFYLLRSNFERGKILDREFLRKTARLVQEHTESGRIDAPDKFYFLDSDALGKIAAGDEPDTVKVFNLVKAIQGLVNQRKGWQPFLIPIGERAEAIAHSFEERQLSTQQALDEFTKMLKEIEEAQRSSEETGLSPEAFAMYWMLKKEGMSDPLKAAQGASAAFERSPHWQTSERQERDVKRSIYKVLVDAGVEHVVDMGQRLLKLLRSNGS